MSATSDLGVPRPRPASSHRPFFRRAAPAGTPSPTPTRGRADRPPPPPESRSTAPVALEVHGLKTYFFTYDGVVRALDGVNLTIRKGETTGIVGETGCGKSVTAFSIDRLINEPGRIVAGSIVYRGADVLWGLDKEAKFRRQKGTGRITVKRSFRRIKAANERMAAIRGRGVSMIFQEPMQAMNPVFSVSDQLGEAVLLHRGLEVVDGLLEADRGKGSGHGDVNAEELEALVETPPPAPAPTQGSDAGAGAAGDGVIHDTIGGWVHAMVLAAEKDDRPALRDAAHRLAEHIRAPTAETELYYMFLHSGTDARRQGRRAVRALHRFRLTGSQRGYLKHQRRLMELTDQVNETYLREMQAGRLFRAARSKSMLQMRFEKLKGLRFRIPGYGRHAQKPLKQEAFWRTVQLLEGVRIANPAQVAKSYPHELSGGMLQRVMIAMALCSDPEVLLADEPTTALDVTIQAQILELLNQLRQRVGTAIVLITHDLGVVAEVCDSVNVMYAGVVVENAPVKELFQRPLHPYTQGLLSAVPRMDRPDKELSTIPGSVPNLITPPPGCRFHPRCPYAMPVCRERRPTMTTVGQEHTVACFLYEEAESPEPEEAAEPVALVPAAARAGTA